MRKSIEQFHAYPYGQNLITVREVMWDILEGHVDITYKVNWTELL